MSLMERSTPRRCCKRKKGRAAAIRDYVLLACTTLQAVVSFGELIHLLFR